MAKVTRDDVARLAGTSTAVVSYVINNGPRPVAPATREKVVAAIEQLGYRPNSVAQAMASRRTNLIGMVVPDARQPFFAEMAHAVERAASERGKLVLIGNSDYVDDREVHYVRAFLGMRVSGLILVSQGPSQRAAEEFAAMEGRRSCCCTAAPRRSTTSRWSPTTWAAPRPSSATCWRCTGTRTWPASAARSSPRPR